MPHKFYSSKTFWKQYPYRTLLSYKLFWAVCLLFPQRWRTLNIQSRETIGQEDHVTCLILGPRVNSSPAPLSHLQDAYFLLIRRLQTPSFSLTKFLRGSNTLLSAWINRREKQTPWMGLVDIHIQGLWDAFPSLRNCSFLTIEKDILNLQFFL